MNLADEHSRPVKPVFDEGIFLSFQCVAMTVLNRFIRIFTKNFFNSFQPSMTDRISGRDVTIDNPRNLLRINRLFCMDYTHPIAGDC